MLHVLYTVYVKFLFMKYTSKAIFSAENKGEVKDNVGKMRQRVDNSDKYSQLILKSFDNLSKDDEDTS